MTSNTSKTNTNTITSILILLTVSVEKLLSEYEAALSEVMIAGINIVTQNYTQNWDYLQSVFFSTTILTTIGPVLTMILAALFKIRISVSRSVGGKPRLNAH